MKKSFITITLATAVAAFGFAAFSACSIDSADDNQFLSGSMTIVVDSKEEGKEAKEYVVDLSAYSTKDHVDDVIDDLSETSSFYYEGYNGVYGMYYTAMGYQYQDEESGYYLTEYILQQDSVAGKYLYIYTSVVADQDTSAYKVTAECKGKSVVSSAFGASSMHLEDGAVVYFTYIVY